MAERTIDIGIITIISKEIEALLDVFDARQGKEKIGDQVYFRASIYCEQAKRNLSIVITFLKGQGNTESAITTTNFLNDWYPRIMCLVGIAAGIKEKTNIGDVILPSLIHDYTIKAYKDLKYRPRSKSLSRPDIINTTLTLNPLDQKEFYTTCMNELSKDIKNAEETLLIGRTKDENTEFFSPRFEIRDGNIVSDNTLIRDNKYFEKILEGINDRCQGGEMESAGFVRACQVERSNFPWIVVRGVSDYGDINKGDVFQSIAAKSACIALRELLKHSINIDDFEPNPKSLELERSLQFDIIKHINEAYESEDWTTVCILGPLISRYLYLASQHDLLIEIGRKVEQAAVQLEDDKVRAKILIDDIGWTLFIHGEKKRAKANIRSGLTLALTMEDHYLSAKAYRHLASIDRRNGDYHDAETKLNMAEKEAEKIPNNKKKTEIQASLKFSNAKLTEKQISNDEDITICIEDAEKAAELFLSINDVEREIKTYRFIGDLYCKRKDFVKAKEAYRTGLEKSLETHRYDTIEENGLALIGLTEQITIDEKIRVLSQIKRFCIDQHLKSKIPTWNKMEKEFINERNSENNKYLQ